MRTTHADMIDISKNHDGDDGFEDGECEDDAPKSVQRCPAESVPAQRENHPRGS